MYLVDHYLHLPGFQDLMEENGYEEGALLRELSPKGDTRGTLEFLRSDPVRREAASLVSDRLLDELTLCGGPAECRDRYETILGWGFDMLVLTPFPADGDWITGWRSVINAFQR
jgi:hypothetical protein